MYDYMKALQRQFETKPRSIQNLSDEVDRTHKELSSRLVKDDRKLLLRLVDMEDSLRGLATLHSFICGYHRPKMFIYLTGRDQNIVRLHHKGIRFIYCH